MLDGGGIGPVISPMPSIGPFARVAPRPRTAGGCSAFRSFWFSVGETCVNTLLIARSGLPAFLDPRSAAAGPVGGPRLMGEDGRGPCGVRPEPRGPLGALDTLVCKGGPPGPLP